MAIPTPPASAQASQAAMREYLVRNQGGVMKGPRTTQSITGGRQFNVTAQSLSDIMQGTMSVRGPEEMDLVINKALSNNLDYLYGSDYSTVSAFSTAKYDFHASGSIFGAATTNTTTTNTTTNTTVNGTPITGVDLTVYSPQTGGDAIEGGLESARDGLDGQSIVRTLDDVNAGTAEYVTLAGNPSFYKKQYNIPTITYDSYKSGGKQSVTLTNVTAYVHDTGSAFTGKPEGRYDVPVGKDYSDSQMNSQPFAGKDKIQLIPSGSAGGGVKEAFLFLQFALSQVGDPYSTAQNQGATVPLIPNPTEFDCTNLIYWAAVQAGFTADWPGYGEWAESKTIQNIFNTSRTKLSREEAKTTAGAIFTRQPPDQAVGQGSHSCISLGNGAVLESTGGHGVGVNSLGNKFPSGGSGVIAGYIPGMVFTGPIAGLPTGGGTSRSAVNASPKVTGGGFPGRAGTTKTMGPI